MIRMNWSPPLPIEESRLAMFPAVNARIRNRSRRNIGCSTRVSMKQKTISSSKPPPISAITFGLVQPMV